MVFANLVSIILITLGIILLIFQLITLKTKKTNIKAFNLGVIAIFLIAIGEIINLWYTETCNKEKYNKKSHKENIINDENLMHSWHGIGDEEDTGLGWVL